MAVKGVITLGCHEPGLMEEGTELPYAWWHTFSRGSIVYLL